MPRVDGVNWRYLSVKDTKGKSWQVSRVGGEVQVQMQGRKTGYKGEASGKGGYFGVDVP